MNSSEPALHACWRHCTGLQWVPAYSPQLRLPSPLGLIGPAWCSLCTVDQFSRASSLFQQTKRSSSSSKSTWAGASNTAKRRPQGEYVHVVEACIITRPTSVHARVLGQSASLVRARAAAGGGRPPRAVPVPCAQGQARPRLARACARDLATRVDESAPTAVRVKNTEYITGKITMLIYGFRCGVRMLESVPYSCTTTTAVPYVDLLYCTTCNIYRNLYQYIHYPRILQLHYGHNIL